MPVFNEAAVLPRTLDRLAAVELPIDWELVVVDDGSTDGGVDAIQPDHLPGVPIRVLRADRNRGKGAAIRRGFAAAEGSIVGVQDADLEYDPADIPRLLAPLLEGRADAVFGSRSRDYVPYARSYALGNRFLGLVAAILFRRRVSDLYTGYKFVARPLLERLRLTADGFDIEAEISAQLFLAKARIVEVPISYAARSREEGKKLTPRDGAAGLVRLLRVRVGR